jgi:hypothetical protein
VLEILEELLKQVADHGVLPMNAVDGGDDSFVVLFQKLLLAILASLLA